MLPYVLSSDRWNRDLRSISGGLNDRIYPASNDAQAAPLGAFIRGIGG